MAGHLTDRRRYLEAGRQRLADARVLLGAGRWNGAVYLAGFAVECLLKSLLLARRGARTLDREHWHHDLWKLAAAAGVDRELKQRSHAQAGEAFALLTNEWGVTIRYEGRRFSPPEADEIFRGARRLMTWLAGRV